MPHLIKQGDILISDPHLADPNFARSVIYLAEHSAEGSLGFVLNQPVGISLCDVIQTEGEFELDIPLYSGGPVGRDTIHVLHQLGDHVNGSKYISDHIYWGGDFEQIKFLLANKNANWNEFRFFLGYSGWSPGQLEEEFGIGSWIKLRGRDEMLFNWDPETCWEQALEEKGGRYKLLAKAPLRPDWN